METGQLFGRDQTFNDPTGSAAAGAVTIGQRGIWRAVGEPYIFSGMSEDGLPVLPGFRELAQRRRELLAELVANRRAAGLTQTEVAVRMGTSQPAIARLETGEVDLRFSTVERYASAIGRRVELRVSPETTPTHQDDSTHQDNPTHQDR